MERYILKSEYVDYDSHELAVLLTDLLCDQKSVSATILVPTKKNFKNVTLRKIFTDKAMRDLSNGKEVKLPCDQPVRVEAEKTINPNFETGIVLAMYVNEKMLAILDRCIGAKAVVVVPWAANEVKAWVENWAPIEVDPVKLGITKA